MRDSVEGPLDAVEPRRTDGGVDAGVGKIASERVSCGKANVQERKVKQS
jgi:hypothetical protein